MKQYAIPFQGQLWKALPGQYNLIVVECRDTQARKVSFSAIDATKGSVVWTVASPMDEWWTTLKEVTEGHVVLIAYNNPDMPEPKGVSVLDIKTGKVKWTLPEVQYVQSDKEGVLINEGTAENASYRKMAWQTGHLLQAVNLKDLFKGFNKKEKNPSLKYPYHFDTENEFYPKLQEFIGQVTQEATNHLIEYLEEQGKLIISYYLCEADVYTNKLCITDEDGKLLSVHTLVTDAKGVGLDTFFVLSNVVVFVQGKNTLVIIEL